MNSCNGCALYSDSLVYAGGARCSAEGCVTGIRTIPARSLKGWGNLCSSAVTFWSSILKAAATLFHPQSAVQWVQSPGFAAVDTSARRSSQEELEGVPVC